MTKQYIIFEKTTGRVVCHGTCANPELIDLDDANGVLIDVSLKAFSYVDPSGQLIEIPEPSNEFYTFNYTTRQWEDTRTPEIEWPLVRAQRDALLQACDWTQLPDVPLATKDAWATYRQALRDITLQPDPFSITWPPAP